jgi:hypothetical protein
MVYPEYDIQLPSLNTSMGGTIPVEFAYILMDGM